MRPSPWSRAHSPAAVAAFCAPAFQIALTIALVLALIVALTWLAGRMYRNAALRTGSGSASATPCGRSRRRPRRDYPFANCPGRRPVPAGPR
jgi:hypothetical protein